MCDNCECLPVRAGAEVEALDSGSGSSSGPLSCDPVGECVLVTGGDGFLGKRLIPVLQAAGFRTATYDITKKQDILNPEQFRSAVVETGATSVIHLAAIADLYIMRNNPEQSNRINIEGTRNVVTVCNELGARMLFASTCCAYGNNDCHPSNEDSPLCPTEVYAQSKKEGEQILSEFGAPHVSLRFATFYGPQLRMSLVVAVFLDAVHRGQAIKVHGDGLQTRTYTYVDDIVSGILTVLQNKEPYYSAVNISTDVPVSVLDVAEAAMATVGQRVDVIHTPDRPGQILREYIDNSRLCKMGWRPSRSFQQGVDDTYADMLTNSLAGVPRVDTGRHYDPKDAVNKELN